MIIVNRKRNLAQAKILFYTYYKKSSYLFIYQLECIKHFCAVSDIRKVRTELHDIFILILCCTEKPYVRF